MNAPNLPPPWPAFRFHVDFREDSLHAGAGNGDVPLCSGAFSECSGIEATMEPKVVQVGGLNYGAVQRVGPVTFATVVLKRGMTSSRDLWRWFELVNSNGYGYRLTATIAMLDQSGKPALAWQLARCLPVKFKAADLDAKTEDVAIEELHLAHEGLHQSASGAGAPGAGGNR